MLCLVTTVGVSMLFIKTLSGVQDEELESLRENIEAVDQNRPPLRVINGYAILDHLGTGAFGSVFKVLSSTNKSIVINCCLKTV